MTKCTKAASIEIRRAITAIIEKHDLTYGELFSILANSIEWWSRRLMAKERNTSVSFSSQACGLTNEVNPNEVNPNAK